LKPVTLDILITQGEALSLDIPLPGEDFTEGWTGKGQARPYCGASILWAEFTVTFPTAGIVHLELPADAIDGLTTDNLDGWLRGAYDVIARSGDTVYRLAQGLAVLKILPRV